MKLITIFIVLFALYWDIISPTSENESNSCANEMPSLYNTPTNLSGNLKKRRNAIVFLIPAFGQALDGLPCSLPCSTVDKAFLITQIVKMDTAMLDNFDADVVIFHEGYPEYPDVLEIRNSTKRSIDFVNIDLVFTRIPENLDAYYSQPTWSKRAKWRYQQMIRFMVTDIFKFPVMDNVDYFMRIDIDSCFRNSFSNLFSLLRGPGKKTAYLANNENVEASHLLPGTHHLKTTVNKYIADNKIVPRSQARWARAFPNSSVMTYNNNFEIVSVEFFRKPEIIRFISYIEESLGIFLYRWGDAGLRFVTLAIFASDAELLNIEDFNIDYQHPC